MAVHSGKTLISAAVISEVDIDLDTALLELGDWSDDVNLNGMLNQLKLDASSICFDSEYEGAVPLQNGANIKSEAGEEFSGGNKEDVLTVTLMAEDLDNPDNVALLAQVVDVDLKSKVVYVFDPISGTVRKLSNVKFGRNFDATGGQKEVYTITGTWSGTLSEDFQIKTLIMP